MLFYCVGRPIAVDWALSKDHYQKAVEHSGIVKFWECIFSITMGSSKFIHSVVCS